jgi:hypothetical protein
MIELKLSVGTSGKDLVGWKCKLIATGTIKMISTTQFQ